jgi:hypothetical protein
MKKAKAIEYILPAVGKDERVWTVFHNESEVGIRLGDVTENELKTHRPILVNVPLTLKELRLDEIEDPIEERLEASAIGFLAGHVQKAHENPPQQSLFLVREDMLLTGVDLIKSFLGSSARYQSISVEIVDQLPPWANLSSGELVEQLSQLPKFKNLGRDQKMGCLGSLFAPRVVLLDVWFFEEWNYEGQKSPAFEAIERRLVPAIQSRMIGSHEGEGSFVDRVQYNVGFIIKRKFLSTAIEVLSRELRAMGAPRSTKIEVNGQEYPVY